MSAFSRSTPSTSAPADQISTSLEQGRKLMLQLVCGGYLLYLLAYRLLLPGLPMNALGPELITGYLSVTALLLLAVPTIQFRLLTSLIAVAFLPYAAYTVLNSLSRQELPIGYLTWLPLMVLLCLGILGWRVGAGVTLGLLGMLFFGLSLLNPDSSEQLAAWLALDCMLSVLAVVCVLITRFFEEKLQVGQEVSLQLAAARIDALTGVMGRAASELHLQGALTASMQTRSPLSLLICDLDNFKSVNDRYGHPVGDAVLKAAARRLKRQIGGNGQVGRWGGEEFVIILPNTSKSEAMILAEQLRRTTAANPLAGLDVTASFGVAASRSSDTLAELFERADQRLYEAKHSGRNKVTG